MNDHKITEIRERLEAWKAKANTCIDFNAIDVDVLLEAIDEQAARITEVANAYAAVSDHGSDYFYDFAKYWLTEAEKTAAFDRRSEEITARIAAT